MNKKVEKKILLVDDNNIFLETLKKTLINSDFTPSICFDATSALHLFTLDDYQAVITDIQLPGMNGIELLKAIKKIKNTPVILMTGFSELQETQEAASLGAHGFLAKPFKKEDLLELLNQFYNDSDDKKKIKEDEKPGDKFSKIKIEDFASGKEIRY